MTSKFARGAEAFAAEAPKAQVDPVYYLTIPKYASKCGSCGEAIGKEPYVYCHEPKTIRCWSCADAEGIEYRETEAYDRWVYAQGESA